MLPWVWSGWGELSWIGTGGGGVAGGYTRTGPIRSGRAGPDGGLEDTYLILDRDYEARGTTQKMRGPGKSSALYWRRETAKYPVRRLGS